VTKGNIVKLPVPVAQELFEDKQSFDLPRIIPVEQIFERHEISNIEEAVSACCNREGLGERLRPGMRIGLACGSRGISRLDEIVKAMVGYLQKYSVEVVIIPAMGSHGGPSAEGQRNLLAGYGISEKALGIPVISSLEVKRIGTTNRGLDVWFSSDALKLDGIIPINRVKPHTDFSGTIESGILKMCAIGLGKHKGACTIHACGFGNLGNNILQAGLLILEKANVLGGLAIVEDAYKNVAALEYLWTASLEQRESKLLALAKNLMPSLPLEDIDMLLVQRMGKDISGAGFDPNITGRRKIWQVADLPLPRIGVMAALELTESSHGNAAGIGIADICSQRLIEAIDFPSSYAGLITATIPQHAHIPMFFADDKQVLMAGAKCARAAEPENMRLVWIRDTSHLDRLWVSENTLPCLAQTPGIRILGKPVPIPFTSKNILEWQEPG